MEIRMELNQRHGHGFQIRLVHGPVNKVYDDEALNLYEAGAYAQTLLELDGLDKDRAAEWIRRTYAQYVQDGGALVQYVMTAS